MESQQVIGLLIPLLRTHVGQGYRGRIDRTSTDD